MSRRIRPARSYDPGLQHERTALAWERTAIAAMVAGIALARFGATTGPRAMAPLGIVQTAFGGAVLVWACWHYEDLHGALRDESSVVHPVAARIVGVAAVTLCAVALGAGVWVLAR